MVSPHTAAADSYQIAISGSLSLSELSAAIWELSGSYLVDSRAILLLSPDSCLDSYLGYLLSGDSCPDSPHSYQIAPQIGISGSYVGDSQVPNMENLQGKQIAIS